MDGDMVLKVTNLKKWFRVREGISSAFRLKPQQYEKAVDGVSFGISEGEVFGLAGQSGCGKTTTGKLLLRLIEPDDGKVLFKNCDLLSLKKKELKKMRRNIQMIFQNPYESLSPRLRIHDAIAEPLRIQNIADNRIEEKNLVTDALQSAHLIPPEKFISKYPFELSGGERQRVAIARALVVQPKFVVADEPVSMMDASLRVSILKLILDLKKKNRFTCLFITHDFSMARYMCDRLAIMHRGKIVEVGSTEDLINRPSHPYTRALISAVPVADPTIKLEAVEIKREVGDFICPSTGCRFYPRCQNAKDICRTNEPEMVQVDTDHYVSCHFA